jgi:hypothetical protein
MKKFRIIYTSIGVLLIILLIFTNSMKLPERNKELYEKACDIQNNMQKKTWEELSVRNYPVAIRKENKEYVFYNGEVKKRKSVLPVYVCSIFPVNNEINVLIPAFDEMNEIGNIVEGLSDGNKLLKSQFGFNNNSISENNYISVLYHEAFHAYQFTNYEVMINKMADFDNADKVIEKLDNNDSFKNLYKKEGEILYLAINEKEKDKVVNYIGKYIAARNKRTEILKGKLSNQDFKTLVTAENYYELIEGTAAYVQLKTDEELKDMGLYKQNIDKLKEFSGKTQKYYKSGMAMCIILDKLDNSWKERIFSEGKPLYQKFVEGLGR